MKKDIISYDLLADMNKKKDIDNSQGNIVMCGYPQAKLENINDEWISSIKQPIKFGELLFTIGNEKPSGFVIEDSAKSLKPGDCGRPIIMKIKNNYFVIGLYKGYEDEAVVVDSTAIIRVIDAIEQKLKTKIH